MQDDAFLVHARLGSGTTGAVFRATRPSDGRQVLLKALHPDLLETMDLAHLREVCEALAEHPHHAVASGVELITWRGDTVLVRDLIRGVDLTTVVAGSAPPRKIAMLVAAEIAGALAAVLRTTGFHHGDLKPSNVFIDLQGDIKVVDFGMARPLPEHDNRTLTMFHGSVGFMAPERADNQPIGPGADTYSLGLMLAWMLTGEMPRRTSANPERHATRNAQLIQRVKANSAPEEAVDLIRRCTVYEPELRPPMDEVARTLARLAEAAKGPAITTWATPLIEALLVQPAEVDVTDSGQALSATSSQLPAMPRVGATGTPVQRIRTGAHELPQKPRRRRKSKRTTLLLTLGTVLLILAFGMLAGAIAIATTAG